jgi:hypothetical protein
MENILIFSDLCDFKNRTIYHYSLVKAFNVAVSLSKKINTYYATNGQTEIYNGVNLINKHEITDDFINKINYILIGREPILKDIIDQIPSFKKLLINDNRKQLIGIKSDSAIWVRAYNKISKELKENMFMYDFALKYIDLIYVQTETYKEREKSTVFIKKNNSILDKVRISPMGVPNKLPKIIDTNPYDINHLYCVSDFNSLKSGKALFPLCYTRKNRSYLKYGHTLDDFNKKKTILIYTGRIKIDDGNILYLMRDIMKELGNSYELHIFPGRFCLPGCPVKVFSPKFGYNLQILRDSIFFQNNNVIIHFPYDHRDKNAFLQYADIGIDFSQSRPENTLSSMGNAKLLEYCYFGLKVVVEKNINNSHLVEEGKNGIILKNIASVDDYVKAIKKANKMKINKEYTINKTIENSNWDKISLNILNDFRNI